MPPMSNAEKTVWVCQKKLFAGLSGLFNVPKYRVDYLIRWVWLRVKVGHQQ